MRILLALVVGCCGCEATDDFSKFHVVIGDSGAAPADGGPIGDGAPNLADLAPGSADAGGDLESAGDIGDIGSSISDLATCGVCAPGEQRTIACGNCGSETDTCTLSCQWAAGTCTGQGVCAPTTYRYVKCGNCGQEKDTCTSTCQWLAGACAGQGQCKPGSVQSNGLCLATGYEVCDNFCGWNCG